MLPGTKREVGFGGIGGGDQDRTDDLLIANQTLSQLSYTPTKNRILNANGLFEKWQTGCMVKRVEVAQVVEHCRCSGKVLVAGVVVDCDIGLDACGEAGTQAVVGVFQRDAFAGGETEVVQYPKVYVGRGFFVRHDVAVTDAGEIVLPIFSQPHFE
jgi:hypothetical protein